MSDKEMLKEADEWLYSMKCLLSVKTDEEDRAYTQKRIDLFNWLIEQAERLHGTKHKMGYMDMYADCNRMVGSDSMKIHKLEQQNKELLEGLATIGNAIHEGEISGRGTDENLILEIVDKHWRVRNE